MGGGTVRGWGVRSLDPPPRPSPGGETNGLIYRYALNLMFAHVVQVGMNEVVYKPFTPTIASAVFKKCAVFSIFPLGP